METLEYSERINLINQAITKVQEAQMLIDQALHGLDHYRFVKHCEAYGLYGVDQLLDNGNPYDGSLETLKEELEKEFNSEFNENE